MAQGIKKVDDFTEDQKRSVSIAQKAMRESFDLNTLHEIVAQTVRKCEVNGKGRDYLPILLENEMRDYQMRKRINDIGRMNYDWMLQRT